MKTEFRAIELAHKNDAFQNFDDGVYFLDKSVVGFEEALSVLSEQEQRKCQSFKFSKDARLYATAHFLKRRVLSSLTNLPTQALNFSRSRTGKPYLENDRDLKFNLSHSGDYVALFVFRNKKDGAEIGVDLEDKNNKKQLASFKHAFLHSNEISLNNNSSLLRRWTEKEALSKAIGLGLLLDFPSIDLSKKSLFEYDGASYWLANLMDNNHFILSVSANFNIDILFVYSITA